MIIIFFTISKIIIWIIISLKSHGAFSTPAL